MGHFDGPLKGWVAEEEQMWWYLLRDGVIPDGPLTGWVFRGEANMVVFIGARGPDGPLTGWVAEAAMKAVENSSPVDGKCI